MLSLRELRRAAQILAAQAVEARLARVVQPDELRLVLTLHAPRRGDVHLLLCAEPAVARASVLGSRPAAPAEPPPFCQLARARLRQASLAGVELVDEDRQLALRFATPEGERSLLLSILGARTNLYLLDAERRILGALRALGRTRRDLVLGAPWSSPESKPPAEGRDRFEAAPDAGYFAAVEAHYWELEVRSEEEALRRRLERALGRAGQALARKAEALARDAAATGEAPELRRQGELLKSVLARVRVGASEARARDFATGEEVVIPLDPARSPAANLEHLFRRARKAERRGQRSARELGALEERRATLNGLAAELEAAATAADPASALAALAAQPDVARLLARYAPEPSPRPEPRPRSLRLGKRELPRRLEPRRFRSSNGLEIWVGRSDEGNDLLTTRLARGNDLFFHLDQSPGSHVVLRTEGRGDPPGDSVLEACELAVHFSRQRDAGRVDVLVAPIKNVRKPPRAKPGLVWVTGGKTVRLRRDRRRLERVLAARVDPEG